MGLSENVEKTPKNPMVLLIIIPTKWLAIIGGIPHFQTHPYTASFPFEWSFGSQHGLRKSIQIEAGIVGAWLSHALSEAVNNETFSYKTRINT